MHVETFGWVGNTGLRAVGDPGYSMQSADIGGGILQTKPILHTNLPTNGQIYIHLRQHWGTQQGSKDPLLDDKEIKGN